MLRLFFGSHPKSIVAHHLKELIMFEGSRCSYLSASVDQHLQRSVGTRSLEEFFQDMLADAASPEQLDALAFQFLCVARRIKGIKGCTSATLWKEASKTAAAAATAARDRLAANPSRESHPGFFNHRSVGKPGCLDSDLFLPFVVQFNLGIPKLSAGIYEPDIEDGAIYTISTVYSPSASRDGKTWITPVDPGKRAFPVRNATLRGLQNLGRLVALPLKAAKKAA